MFKHVSQRTRSQLLEIGAYVAPKKSKSLRSFDDFRKQRLFDTSGMANSVGRGERGLKTNVGRYASGVLTVSKRDIERVLTPEAVTARKQARQMEADRSVVSRTKRRKGGNHGKRKGKGAKSKRKR